MSWTTPPTATPAARTLSQVAYLVALSTPEWIEAAVAVGTGVLAVAMFVPVTGVGFLAQPRREA